MAAANHNYERDSSSRLKMTDDTVNEISIVDDNLPNNKNDDATSSEGGNNNPLPIRVSQLQQPSNHHRVSNSRQQHKRQEQEMNRHSNHSGAEYDERQNHRHKQPHANDNNSNSQYHSPQQQYQQIPDQHTRHHPRQRQNGEELLRPTSDHYSPNNSPNTRRQHQHTHHNSPVMDYSRSYRHPHDHHHHHQRQSPHVQHSDRRRRSQHQPLPPPPFQQPSQQQHHRNDGSDRYPEATVNNAATVADSARSRRSHHQNHHRPRMEEEEDDKVNNEQEELQLEDLMITTTPPPQQQQQSNHRPPQPHREHDNVLHYSLSRPMNAALYEQQRPHTVSTQQGQQHHYASSSYPPPRRHDRQSLISPVTSQRPDIYTHPARCPPLNLEFLWKLYHQRHVNIILPPEAIPNTGNDENNEHSMTCSGIIGRLAPDIRNERITTLNSQGFPTGLATLILEQSIKNPIRIWLVDNCGTMHKSDGHMVSQSSQGKVDVINCTRWEEITSTLIWHAEMAAWQQTPMAVRLLQDPGAQVGPQQLGVSASKHYSSIEEVTRIKNLFKKTRPTGATSPINLHLQELFPAIQSMIGLLQTTKTQLTVCICTDSIPTDADGNEHTSMIQDFISTLHKIVNFGPNLIHIIWRLSTDEDRVVQFYRSIIHASSSSSSSANNEEHVYENDDTDNHNSHNSSNTSLKNHIMVLDDYVNECEQVQTYNPWLNYGYPLHLCREEGIRHPLLDALSERAIETKELRDVAQLIFGTSNDNHTAERLSSATANTSSSNVLCCAIHNYTKFRKQVETLNKQTGVLWNPIKKKFVPWISIKKLDRHIAALESACSRTSKKTQHSNNNNDSESATGDAKKIKRKSRVKSSKSNNNNNNNKSSLSKISSIIGWR